MADKCQGSVVGGQPSLECRTPWIRWCNALERLNWWGIRKKPPWWG